MSSLKDVFFKSILKMPLEILQLAGFNYLKHTTPGQKQKSRLETISENAKMFNFWFSFANFALFNVLRLIYLISNLKNLNVSIYAVVVITNAFSVLCKVHAIFHHKSAILKMFDTLSESSYDKLNYSAQMEVTQAFKFYRVSYLLFVCDSHDRAFGGFLAGRTEILAAVFLAPV